MLHDNYLCLVESNKQQIEEVRSKMEAVNSETRTTPKRVWIRLCAAHSSRSRDRRIKMKKSIIIIINLQKNIQTLVLNLRKFELSLGYFLFIKKAHFLEQFKQAAVMKPTWHNCNYLFFFLFKPHNCSLGFYIMRPAKKNKFFQYVRLLWNQTCLLHFLNF